MTSILKVNLMQDYLLPDSFERYLIPATETGLRLPPIADGCCSPTRLPVRPSRPRSMLDPDTKLVLSEQKFEAGFAEEEEVVGARQNMRPK